MYKHILIATDGSDVGQKGLDHGLSLAKALGARVTIVTVSEPFPLFAGSDAGYAPSATMIENYQAEQKSAADTILTAANQVADRVGVSVETIRLDSVAPAEAIVEAAKSHNCDLIVMGSHGRRGLGRLVLGSKTSEVVAHGHVPVLVVR